MNRNFLRKAIGPLAGAAAVLAVLVVALPPAAKALVATLVQVVNTPTNAIPTVHAPAAANLYYSSCSGSGGNSCELTAVPAGQTLFVETISMFANGPHGTVVGTGSFQGWGPQGGQPILVPLQQTASNPSGFDDYAGNFAGRIFASAGPAPGCAMPTAATYTCWVYGYLTPTN
jgi:hypothetical protein